MSNEGLPNGWTSCKLAETVTILDSQRVPVNNTERQARLKDAEFTYPYYGATGQVGEIDDFIFEGEAILLGEDGAPFFDPRKSKAYMVNGQYWVNNHAHILRAVDGTENAFICHQLNTLDYRAHVSGTTRLKLTQNALKNLPLKLAPRQEQPRIVEKIETLFARIDKGEEALREVQKLLKRYRQSILKAAVTGELTRDWREANKDKLEPAGDLLARILETRRENWQGGAKYSEPVCPEIVGLLSLPEGWVWASVDHLLRSALSNGRSVKTAENGFPVLRLTALKGGRIDLGERKIGDWTKEGAMAYCVQQGDILVSRGNGSKQLVGRGGLVDEKPDPVAFPDTMIRIPLNLFCVDAEWFVHLWNSPFMRAQIESSAKTTAGIYKINQGDIRSFTVPLPSLAEQREIAVLIDGLMAGASQLEAVCQAELTRSNSLRQSILKSAFTGKLVPQDPNDEPASELLARIRAEAQN